MYLPNVARSAPNHPAYVMAESGDSLTYQQLDRLSNQLAHCLRQHGASEGDTLLLMCENRIEWPVVVAAGMRTGLFVTPVNWHLTAGELRPILEEAPPKVIVTSGRFANTLQQALPPSIPEAPLLLSVDDAAGFRPLARSIAKYPATPVPDERLGARVLYSGGTTGRPRAHRHAMPGIHPADAPTRHAGLGQRLGIDTSTRLLSAAPSYHAAPFTLQLMVLGAGGTVVCMESWDAADAMAAIVRHEVTHSQWVPTMLTRLLELPGRENYPLSPTHRVAFTSGAPCPPDVKARIAAWWGPILHEYYGASEGLGHTYIGPEEAVSHPGSVGRPVGGQVAILDEGGRPVPTGHVGDVVFGSPEAVLTGSPTDTEWRGMGDRGYLDAQGYLYLVGRASFMINSGGVNIYPEEIEALLQSHPAVADVAVFGIPDAEFGEQVKGVVELSAGYQPDPTMEAELIAHCRNHLARFKAPRSIDFLPSLPRSTAGKLNKAALRSRYLTQGKARS